MKTKGNFKLKGVITLRHKRDGEVIDEQTINNTITNAGLDPVAGLINGQVANEFKWLAIGTSSTAATASDTGLAAELTDPTGLDREIANTITQATTNQTNDTARQVTTYTNNSSNTIGVQEAGLFNTSTEGGATMLGRQTFSTKNLANNDTLQVQYDIVVA